MRGALRIMDTPSFLASKKIIKLIRAHQVFLVKPTFLGILWEFNR